MVRFCVASLMLFFALLSGCARTGKARARDALFDGPIELTVENRTHLQIEMLEIRQAAPPPDRAFSGGEQTRALVARSTDGIMIAAGASAHFKLAPGTYLVSSEGAPTNSGYSYPSSMVKLLVDYQLNLRGPTQLVLYETTPPTDVAEIPGTEQVMARSWTESAHDQANSDYAACQQAVPEPNERPMRARTRIDGTWTCVMGGEVRGTNLVHLVQLANGAITATLSGADRSSSWEGVVRGDELRYRFAGVDTAGGILQIDPSGRAMTGSGATWVPNEAHCRSYSMTCTR